MTSKQPFRKPNEDVLINLFQEKIRNEPPITLSLLEACNTKKGCDVDKFTEYHAAGFEEVRAIVRDLRESRLIARLPTSRWTTTRFGELWLEAYYEVVDREETELRKPPPEVKFGELIPYLVMGLCIAAFLMVVLSRCCGMN